MFFHLLFIHLFRPFLKYNPNTSPLPLHVSPRKLCTQAAASVSKLMRIYKRTYGLRQICNIAVYIVHSACTIHLLNLPEKIAKRDIVHGVKHLEEIAEDWLCARRTLSILSVLARKWKVELPDEASVVFNRTDAKYGIFSTTDVPSPKADLMTQSPPSTTKSLPQGSQPAVPQVFNPYASRSQNQLQQSLYSYIPEVTPTPPITTTQPLQSYQTMYTSAQPPHQINVIGSMNLPSEPDLGSVPYSHQAFNSPLTNTVAAGGVFRQSNSDATSGATTSTMLSGQVSPSTIFGSADALVESQDWWLRDQASMALGFDNWEITGMNGMNGNGNGTSSSSISGIGFYISPVENRGSDVYNDEDWNIYI
jgi:hypothetical protein